MAVIQEIIDGEVVERVVDPDAIATKPAPRPAPRVIVVPPPTYPKRKPSPDRVHRPGLPVASIDTLCGVVCEYYHLTRREMCSTRQWRSTAKPRQVFMYLSRRMTNKSYEEIGEFLGRHHTTVMHGERQVGFDIECDPEMARRVEILTERAFAFSLKGVA